MPRNLNRRVEVVFPVRDPKLIRDLRDDVLATYLADEVKARHMRPTELTLEAQIASLPTRSTASKPSSTAPLTAPPVDGSNIRNPLRISRNTQDARPPLSSRSLPEDQRFSGLHKCINAASSLRIFLLVTQRDIGTLEIYALE